MISGLVAASATLFWSTQVIAVVDMDIAVSNFVDLSTKERRFDSGDDISRDGCCTLSSFMEGDVIDNFDGRNVALRGQLTVPALSSCPIQTAFIL